MKKYYDMPNSKMVAMLDWKDGYGTLEQAREYLSDKDTREISKSSELKSFKALSIVSNILF